MALLSAVAVLTSLADFPPRTATAAQSNVFVTSVICQSKLSLYERTADKRPTVYIDSNVAAFVPTPLDTFSASDNSFRLALSVPAGFDRILVATKYGGESAMLDVLPGHSRHIVLQICQGLLHTDTLRSVAVVLPSGGLAPYLVIHTPRGDQAVQMSIEDGVAYGDLLDEGAIELIVPYWDRLESCSFVLAQATPGWRRQHLRFTLPISALVTRSNGPIPAKCGAIQSL